LPVRLKLDSAALKNVLRRSQLYVPGNNERMILKAVGLGADSVILDLEDAVPSSQKGMARATVAKVSKELDWGRRELCARVNALGTPDYSKDIALLKRVGMIDTILVPRAEGDCSAVSRRSGKSIIPIVETAKGLMKLEDVARSDGVVALTYGAADYASSVGGSVAAYTGSEVIKTLLVAAAASYGVEALDNVFFDLDDLDGFRAQAMAARSLGYAGKQVVHPSQIRIANQVFSPSKAEVEWASKVAREFRRASAKKLGAIRVDGRLIDAVHYRLAKGILEKDSASG